MISEKLPIIKVDESWCIELSELENYIQWEVC